MRLQVTRKTDLALQVLCVIGEQGTRQSASALAERVATTPGFLPQVMAVLVQQGWLMSTPGPNGGYQLMADLNRLTILDVVQAVEGPLEDNLCVLWSAACAEEPCPLHEAWVGAREVLREVLQSTSLSDVITSGRIAPGLNQEIELI